MNIITWFTESVMTNSMMILFLVIGLGYLIGSIKVCGLDLGSAGVLLVALIFGHFGFTIPGVAKDLGLICFVTSVGYIAGPKFFRNFKAKPPSIFVCHKIGAIFTKSMMHGSCR